MKPSTLTRLKSLKLTRTAPTPAARLSLLHLLDQGLQAPAVRAILVNKDFSQDLVSTTTTTTIIIITTSVSVESVRSPRPVRQNHSEGMSRKYFCARNNFSPSPGWVWTTATWCWPAAPPPAPWRTRSRSRRKRKSRSQLQPPVARNLADDQCQPRTQARHWSSQPPLVATTIIIVIFVKYLSTPSHSWPRYVNMSSRWQTINCVNIAAYEFQQTSQTQRRPTIAYDRYWSIHLKVQ